MKIVLSQVNNLNQSWKLAYTQGSLIADKHMHERTVRGSLFADKHTHEFSGLVQGSLIADKHMHKMVG